MVVGILDLKFVRVEWKMRNIHIEFIEYRVISYSDCGDVHFGGANKFKSKDKISIYTISPATSHIIELILT